MARTANTDVAATVAQHIIVTGLLVSVSEAVNQDGQESFVIRVNNQKMERFVDALYFLKTYFSLTKVNNEKTMMKQKTT